MNTLGSRVSVALGMALCGCVDTGQRDAAPPVPVEPAPRDAAPALPEADSGLPSLPLRAEGRFVLDASGARFKLAGGSWYGAESATLVPDGLDRAPLDSIAAQVREMGFNSVRLPWCNEMVATDRVVAPADVAANPALAGKTVLEVFDAVIDALARQGIVVILDNHRSRGDWCCDTAHGDGLWYTEQYPEEVWLEHWRLMTRRYLAQPAVVGMDLRNEPRGQLAPGVPAECVDCNNPTESCVCEWSRWGSNTGTDRDWASAAERGGSAILELNPDLLIIVEGPDWGSWIGASYRPIQLPVPNRLVYSVHKYSFDYDGDCAAWKTSVDSAAGYLVAPGGPVTAPLWLGEFGIHHAQTTNPWWTCLLEYVADKDLDWSYWALNGTQGPGYNRTDGGEEGYGILDVTWSAPANLEHLEQLQAIVPARLLP